MNWYRLCIADNMGVQHSTEGTAEHCGQWFARLIVRLYPDGMSSSDLMRITMWHKVG